jgi:hypothetical protein
VDTDLPSWVIPAAIAGVIVLGAIFGALTLWQARRRGARLDLWSRAAYGLWTGGEDCSAWPQARARASLGDWYGATTRPQLDQVIAGLRQGQTGYRAWDLIRALDLLRIAIAAGFLDLEDSRKRAGEIVTELQKTYSGWEEMAKAFEDGMHAWQSGRGVRDPAETGRVQRNLPTLRQQYWRQVAWKAQVVGGD